MLPALRPGDCLLVSVRARVRVGDVVVVRRPHVDGLLLVKRAIRREDAGWWVLSDNGAAGLDDSRAFGVLPDAASSGGCCCATTLALRRRLAASRRGAGPDRRPLRLVVFEFERGRDVVAGDFDEVLARQVGATRVAEQDVGAAGAAAQQEREHAGGELALVTDVAREHDVGGGQVGIRAGRRGAGRR